ncbi:membrane protein insertase YidC [Vineibacter terrae]|uniref:membrane protein insertase YidC n=1 Tax=Vineibacter terrae TaxID=2586908 RepID=UPI002E378B7E|nr:membrane protein insertase YidC [Vineibacter terrae]HEX2891184.1 membrane protein insertase YidC [Vineibacter terrae]
MDQRNLILAIALSIAIIVGWQALMPPAPPPPPPQQQQQPSHPVPSPGAPGTPGTPVPSAGSPPAPAATREEALKTSPRVTIATPQIEGSIALRGARIDDVLLAKHRVTVEKNSPLVTLLSPERSPNGYYVRFGWSNVSNAAVKLPDADTLWTADRTELAAGQPLTLSWDNGEGLIFRQKITLDQNFMFTVALAVDNKTDKPVSLFPYGLVTREGDPKTEGIYLLHEGPYGVYDEVLKEFSWSDFKDGKKQTLPTTGGWLGFTDKYWMVTLIPDQKTRVATEISQSVEGGTLKKYHAFFRNDTPVTVAPGASSEATARLFAGAKIVTLIDQYHEALGIARFDLTIDWGWFWFLTKPLFWLLDKLFGLIGNFGIAILALTVLVKLAFFPLANKSYESMTKMKALQPEMEKLRARFADDKMAMNQELMKLYKSEKVNPAAGCLPVLLQIPVFFALYKVLYTTIEMRHQPFFGWIHDLAAPDPLTLLQGFGLLHWQVPPLLHIFDIGIWPIIMGITMYMQQMLNPQPADPVQARIFQFLPIMFTFMLGQFAAGLVIYWAWNNTLSMAQQYAIMRRLGVPVSFGAKAPAPAAKPAAPPAPTKPAAAGKTAGRKK